MERHLSTEPGGVCLGYSQRFGRYVYGFHLCIRHLQCQRYGYAAAAGAYIEDMTALTPTPSPSPREGSWLFTAFYRGTAACHQPLPPSLGEGLGVSINEQPAQFLGFGTRNEHSRSHCEAAATEAGTSQHILYWLALLKARHRTLYLLPLRIIETVDAASIYVGKRQPGQLFEQHTHHCLSFRGRVNARQPVP